MPKFPKQSNIGQGDNNDIPMNVSRDDSSIQLRAYQIYHEKGGSAVDNWLEAEQILKDREHVSVAQLMNERAVNIED